MERITRFYTLRFIGIAVLSTIFLNSLAFGWSITENFTDTAWRGTYISANEYQLADDVHGWDVDVSGGNAYARTYTSSNYRVGMYAPSSGNKVTLSRPVPSLTSGRVKFRWSSAVFPNQGAKLQFVGPGGVIAYEASFGVKWNGSAYRAFMQAYGTTLLNENSDLPASVEYNQYAIFTFDFNCVSDLVSSIDARSVNRNWNHCTTTSDSFDKNVYCIEEIRLIAEYASGAGYVALQDNQNAEISGQSVGEILSENFSNPAWRGTEWYDGCYLMVNGTNGWTYVKTGGNYAYSEVRDSGAFSADMYAYTTGDKASLTHNVDSLTTGTVSFNWGSSSWYTQNAKLELIGPSDVVASTITFGIKYNGSAYRAFMQAYGTTLLSENADLPATTLTEPYQFANFNISFDTSSDTITVDARSVYRLWNHCGTTSVSFDNAVTSIEKIRFSVEYSNGNNCGIAFERGKPIMVREPVGTLTVVAPSPAAVPGIVRDDTKYIPGPYYYDYDAAEDLADYLSDVTGRTITASDSSGASIVFHVGRDSFVNSNFGNDMNDLYADGFIIGHTKVSNVDHIILAGNDDASSQWAVEEFLKEYAGVRWLNPDSTYGAVVPSKTYIIIPNKLWKVYEPDFMTRHSGGQYLWSHWPYRLRLPSIGDLGQFGDHGLQYIFDSADFNSHPEWFAYFNGQRNHWAYGNGWQICTSNSNTVTHAVAYVKDFFDDNPSYMTCSIGQNDGAGWCECANCTTNFSIPGYSAPYSISDRWFYWVKQVADQLALDANYAGKYVEAMAYGGSGATSPPPRFALPANVAITKTFMDTSEFTYADDWMDLVDSLNLYSYTYGSGFMGFRHYPHAMRDFLKWGHDDMGAMAHVTECGGDWSFDAPKYFYNMAFTWDVDADPAAVMWDFCKNSYGDGAAAYDMLNFWNKLEEIYDRCATRANNPDRRLSFYQWVSWQDPIYLLPNDEFMDYTSDDINDLDDYIEDTYAAASGNNLWRVSRIRDAWYYARTMILSYIDYYKTLPSTTVNSTGTQDAAFNTAEDIADIRADRSDLFNDLVSYAEINYRMSQSYYWSYGAALTIFSNERSLIDELCSNITAYMGTSPARTYWGNVSFSSNLYEAAQTQLWILDHSLTNTISNGTFENNLTGWSSTGTVAYSTASPHGGSKCARMSSGEATLSQSVDVSAHNGDIYRLTVWANNVSVDVNWAIPPEARVEFTDAASNPIYVEPTRAIYRSTSSGWTKLVTTVKIPFNAKYAQIKLRKTYTGTADWDDIKFERIYDGPGDLEELFGGSSLDTTKWVKTSGDTRSTAPSVSSGWLNYNNADMYSVHSIAEFDDLIKYSGSGAYRLKVHVASLSSPGTAICWGILDGTDAINIGGTGWFVYHYFNFSGSNQALVSAFSYQGGTNTYSSSWWLPVTNPITDVYYTFRFEPTKIIIYAATGAYSEAAGAKVCEFNHGITNMSADGAVYLKLNAGTTFKIDEVILEKP